jgi:hypothetical protein
MIERYKPFIPLKRDCDLSRWMLVVNGLVDDEVPQVSWHRVLVSRCPPYRGRYTFELLPFTVELKPSDRLM